VAEVVVRLEQEEIDVLLYETLLSDMSPHSAAFGSALDKLRAALDSPPVEEALKYRKTASLADKSSWASNTCSGPEQVEALQIPAGWQATNVRDQVRTITTFSDGSELIGPWVDLPSEEGER
jgi:hypothetical protein